MSNQPKELHAIVGEQLCSVEFVQDYVQLHFDGPYVIAFTWPIIEIRGEAISCSEPRYKDALCERITRKVRAASLVEGESLKIEFDDGSVFRISLKHEDRTAPDSVLYRAGSNDRDPILEF